jgi:hypothetical protein
VTNPAAPYLAIALIMALLMLIAGLHSVLS